MDLSRNIILEIDLNTGRISTTANNYFYNTDRNIAYFYIKLYRTNIVGEKQYISDTDSSQYNVSITTIKPKTITPVKLLGERVTNSDVDDNIVYKITIPNELMKQQGFVYCEGHVIYNNQELTTDCFSFKVNPDKLSEYNLTLITDPDLPILQDLINQIKHDVRGIDDNKISDSTVWSSEYTNTKFIATASQIKDVGDKKTDKITTENIQQQVNNLVLGAVGDGNNAEVVQARGGFKTLNERLDANDNAKIGFNKMDRVCREVLNDNLFTVNFQDLKVYVNNNLNYIVGSNGHQYFHSQGKLNDIAIPEDAVNYSVYTQYTFWYDKIEGGLKFTTSDQCSEDNSIVFGFFYQGKPYLNNNGNGIEVINKFGKKVLTSFKDVEEEFKIQDNANLLRGMAHVTFYSTDNTMAIDYDVEHYTITATTKKSHWLSFESSSIKTQEDKVFTLQCNSDNINYSYKLFVNMKDGTPLIKGYNAMLSADEIKNYAFVCAFDNVWLYSPSFSTNCILINGKEPRACNGFEKSNAYDWNNNRFVLPSDLYLVKNIPYSISATDFNMEQLKDNDNCLFEITLPTKTVQFEQTADILIPYSYDHPFRTRIAGKYKYGTSILTQDINLHVANPDNVTKKDVTILCIGDSITQSNYPKHLKWHLAQMGINATMIGTVTNSHEFYSYGISQYLSAEKGEGRGGWRLTDFTCNTPLVNGGYYKNSSFPMMNPTTGKFDFSYYMTQQGFSGVDFVVINLGTNDLGGYHYAGSTAGNSAYGTIRKVDLDTEYLNPESEYYLGKLYKTLIDSIHAYNSDIKIAINPPMGAGDSDFIIKSLKWAEICQYEFKDTTNVYNLASYASQAQLSATNIEAIRPYIKQVNSKNNTYKFKNTPDDVHYNGMGQLIHTLYPASWIVNMCL